VYTELFLGYECTGVLQQFSILKKEHSPVIFLIISAAPNEDGHGISVIIV
jgi:hypothetical protein